MMKKLFLLFSHTLTQTQIDDAVNSFGVKEFVALPANLQTLWSNVPANLESLQDYLEPLKKYVKDDVLKDDIVLIQGDFGAVYEMVSFCKELDLTAIYATTKRETKEITKDDKIIKTSYFKHIRYRKY